MIVNKISIYKYSNNTDRNSLRKFHFGNTKNEDNFEQKSPAPVNLDVTKGQIKGSFNGKDFQLNLKQSLLNKKLLEGKIGDTNYKIESNHKTITGEINGKPVDIKLSQKVMDHINGSYTAVGTIGDEEVNLKVNMDTNSCAMLGKFKNNDVNLNFNSGNRHSEISGSINNDVINLNLRLKALNSNGKLTGKYNADEEFFPILLNTLYDNRNTSNSNETFALLAL